MEGDAADHAALSRGEVERLACYLGPPIVPFNVTGAVRVERLRSISVSEARALLASLIEQVEGGEPYFLVSRSRVRAVLMGIGQYDALLERLEDLEDSLEILRAKAEGEPARPLEEYLKEREAKQSARVSGRP